LRGSLVDLFERDLVMRVISWLPYGGLPEDVALIEFGMTRSQVCMRIRSLEARLHGGVPVDLHDRVRVRQAAMAISAEVWTAPKRGTDDGGLGSGRWNSHRGVLKWVPFGDG
jgi:hypothetical protein